MTCHTWKATGKKLTHNVRKDNLPYKLATCLHWPCLEGRQLINLNRFYYRALLYKIYGIHSGEYSNWGLLNCDTVQCCDRIPMFQRTLLPPSSGWRVKWQQGPLKRWYTTVTLYIVITHKTLTYIKFIQWLWHVWIIQVQAFMWWGKNMLIFLEIPTWKNKFLKCNTAYLIPNALKTFLDKYSLNVD
jgi:hypothetical protein